MLAVSRRVSVASALLCGPFWQRQHMWRLIGRSSHQKNAHIPGSSRPASVLQPELGLGMTRQCTGHGLFTLVTHAHLLVMRVENALICRISCWQARPAPRGVHVCCSNEQWTFECEACIPRQFRAATARATRATRLARIRWCAGHGRFH